MGSGHGPLDPASLRPRPADHGPGSRLRGLHARPCPGRGRGAPSPCRVDDGPLRGRRGRARQLAAGHRRGPGAQANRVDPGAVVPRRARRGRIACLLRPRRRRARTVAARGRRAHLARRPAGEGSEPVPRHRRQRLRLPGAARAHRGRAVARARPRLRHALDRPGRRAHAQSSARAATASGRAIRGPRSTSPTALPAGEPFRCPRRPECRSRGTSGPRPLRSRKPWPRGRRRRCTARA